MKLEDNKLSDARLQNYALKATRTREVLRKRALQEVKDKNGLESEEYLKETERLARKMH